MIRKPDRVHFLPVIDEAEQFAFEHFDWFLVLTFFAAPARMLLIAVVQELTPNEFVAVPLLFARLHETALLLAAIFRPEPAFLPISPLLFETLARFRFLLPDAALALWHLLALGLSSLIRWSVAVRLFQVAPLLLAALVYAVLAGSAAGFVELFD